MLTTKDYTLNIAQSFCKLLVRSAGFAAIALAFVLSPGTARAQSADPALSTAAFFPIRTVVGTTSELRFTFSNSGSTAIPLGSVELAICPAFNFYTSAGAPFGAFASAFTWTAPGPGDDDCWRGVNNVAIAPFGGGQVRLTYSANAVTAGPEITNINVQIINDFLAFQNTTGNDNLQPELEITELPELVVAKTASVTAAGAGTNFTYTLRVSNSGAGPSLPNTVVTDSLPAGITLTGVTAGAGWVCTPAVPPNLVGPGSLSCTRSAGVNAGVANQLVATLAVTKTAGGDVSNTATVTSGDPGCIAPLPARCSSTVVVNDSVASVAVAKGNPVIAPTATPNQYTATYAVTVSNTGTAAGTYTLSDTPGFPATGVTLNSSSVTTVGGTLNTPLPTLVNNTAAQISATGVAIAAAATHTYTVVITFTSSAAATALACNGSPNNGAYNAASITGSATGSDPGCTDLPGAPTVAVAKGNPVIAPTATPNQYTATYAVTVSNTGTAAGTYTLSDTPGFPATGVTLNSSSVTTVGGTLNTPLPTLVNNTAAQISATGVAIAAAATHTYTVVITFTSSAAATALACNGSPNNGAYNAASITGSATGSDPGCTDLPGAPTVAVAKGNPVIAPTATPNQYTATYAVTVSNTGTAAGTYTLSDTPGFPATGVTLNSSSVTTVGGTLNTPLPTLVNNTAAQISATGVAIAAAATHTYTVVITFTSSAAATALACNGSPNNGAYNAASITGSATGSDPGCTDLPGAPTVAVAKGNPVIAPTATPNQYTATYAVTVSNTGTAAGTYTLSDTPGFPATGVTLNSSSVTTVGGTLNTPLPTLVNNTAAQISATGVAIAAAATHTYTVVITFTSSAAATALACNGSPNNGAYNAASITGSATGSDPGCTDLPGAPTVAVAKGNPVIAPTATPNQYTATYAVTVSNTGTAAGTYTLSDTPGFPATGVTLNSSSVTTVGGTLNTPLPTLVNNTAAQISATGVAIAAAATHTYTVVITFTSSAAATALACNGSPNNGAYNAASITGSATGSDPGCTDLPGAPTVAVAKGNPVIAPTATPNQYTATYAVTVSNTGTAAGTYTLSDTPGFPATGVTLNSSSVTTVGGTLNTPLPTLVNNTAAQISATGVAIAAAATHTYTVVITFTSSAAATALACNGSPNNGAYNAASITGSATGSDPGCTDLPGVADMSVTITGLPLTASPGAVLNGTLTCTNVSAGAVATAATCAAAAGTPAGAIVTVGQCVVAAIPVTSPVASLAAGASIVCPLQVTMPANPVAPDSDVTETSVGITGSTGASNDTNAANNTTTVTVAIIDAVNDTGSVGSVAGGLVPILTNDQLGATTNPTVGLNGIKPPTIVIGAGTTLVGASIDAATNQIRVPAGTAPGTYTVEYEICTDPDTSPLACDRAIATITVTNTSVDVVSAITNPAIVGPGQVVAGEIVCTNNGAVAATNVTCTATTATPGANVVVGACVASAGSTAASLLPGGTLTCPLTITAPGAQGGADEPATQVVVDGNTTAANETAGSTTNNSSSGVLAIIDALNDSGSVGSVAGGTINVLGNDRLGGAASAPTIGMGGILSPTIVAGANTTLASATINPTTGLLVVPAGTPPGSYTVEYQICSQAVSTACDRAIVSITVSDTTADMTSAINGLPASNAPGQTVTGTLVCTNAGPAAADSPTCTVATSTPGATVNIVGACTPALPLASPLSATAPNNTISCPIEVIAPVNTGPLSEVTPVVIALAGNTSATNESSAQQGNNASTGSVSVIDALNDSATIGSLAGGTLNVLTNDQNGSATPTVGVGGSNTVTQVSSTAPAGGTPLTLNPATGVITVPPGSTPGVYTVVYDLCSVPATTPPTCDRATATITVDDTSANMTSQINGVPASIGPGATVNGTVVCTNGGPSTAINPTCTIATSTPGAVATISGACTASAGSTLTSLLPGGTISCPIAVTAPANQGALGDVAATTVVVTSNTGAVNEPVALQGDNTDSETINIVDALNDTANVGASGGIVNLLGNDTNGAPSATVGASGNSTITQLPGATAPAGGTPLTLDPATGLVTVPANAVPGVYTVPYQLCSNNPVNACDTALATITVGAGAADMGAAFPASGSSALPIAVAPGQTYSGLQLVCTNLGPNLALTPTCSVSVSVGVVSGLSCAPSNPATLALNGAITCTFNYTAPGTLGGSDTPPQTVQFTGITNAQNDTNSSNNIVQGVAPSGQITIVIDAVDDSATIPSDTGGTVPLLPNDQLGTTTNPSVGASGITAPVIVPGVNTTLPGATINGNDVVVQPGTPSGVYTVEYRICAQAAPTVCDTAIVTITIPGPPSVEPERIPTLDPKLLLVLIALIGFFGARGQRRRG